ncbi:MAG: HTH-type transcriptional activator IlvY [Proteobacteria bacterium]|nr:HTH-type transcriptional activator IlvY [Pseudomonadota bacterium]
MRTEDLKVFLNLAESLSFTKTSQACYMSPSTLSRLVKRMEYELGHRLFDRDNRGVKLTAKGEKFKNFTTETLSRWEDIQLALDQEDTLLKGKIRLLCSVTSTYSMLPALLTLFRKTYPQIQIDLEVGNVQLAHQKLKNNEIDVAVGGIPHKSSSEYSRKVLTVTPMVFIVSKEATHIPIPSDGKKINWEQIPLILLKMRVARYQLKEWISSQGFVHDIYREVDSNEAVLALTNLGCGVGFVPKLVFDKSPLSSGVKIIEIEHNINELTVSLVIKKRNLDHPKFRAFWESIKPLSKAEAPFPTDQDGETS